MRLHVQALFTRDAAERLLAVNEPGGGPAPRFFLGRTSEGGRCWFRDDVDAATAAELEALARAVTGDVELSAAGVAPFVACLSRSEPVQKIWQGPACVFPDELSAGDDTVAVTAANADVLSPFLDPWRVDVARGAPVAAALEGGRAVAICASVRLTPAAHEAGVETHPDFRGRGHGARAARAWAAEVRRLGAIPLYSTSWDNAASLALARTLGLVFFGADLHLT